MPELTAAEKKMIRDIFGPRPEPKEDKPEPKKKPEHGSKEAILNEIVRRILP